jgi:threonine synthase
LRLRSIAGGAKYPANALKLEDDAGNLLEVELDVPPVSRETFDSRLGSLDQPLRSGVWRYRELMPSFPDEAIVSKPEGNTNLYHDQRLGDAAGGIDLWLKHEGENPTGSFKDRGMTAGISHACWVGATIVACASTGNTSASVASYAAAAGLPSIVFVPEGKISAAKLAQTVAYGAHIFQVRGDFDASMEMVRQATDRFGIYLLNSLNPFRLEGQKSIILEALQQLRWQVPDWVVLPGGNLGNVSALGKAIREALAAGLIDSLPRVAVIQAAGAAPFYNAWRNQFASFEPVQADTVASAIRIGNPVNYAKAKAVLRETEGVVEIVNDQEILEAKARIDKAGIGCEPASAVTLAGAGKLVRQGVIQPGERVVAVLTGHVMKDADVVAAYHLSERPGPMANRPVVIDATLPSLERALRDVL